MENGVSVTVHLEQVTEMVNAQKDLAKALYQKLVEVGHGDAADEILDQAAEGCRPEIREAFQTSILSYRRGSPKRPI